MVQKLIELALRNRLVVLLVAAGLFAYGIYSIQKNPIDAIPDLSENQVIVFTEWMGRSPQVMGRPGNLSAGEQFAGYSKN